MIDTSTFGEFLFAAVLIILLPGPSVLFTIGRALAYGRKAAVLTVAGNTCGGLLIALVVAAGVGPLVQSSKALLQTVQIAGALYLVWLGIQAWRSQTDVQAVAVAGTDPGNGRHVREGFLVGALNPKTAVFFATVMPRFVSEKHGSVPLQLLTLGVIFEVIAFTSDSMYGILAGQLRRYFDEHANAIAIVTRVGAMMICTLGAGLLLVTLLEMVRA